MSQIDFLQEDRAELTNNWFNTVMEYLDVDYRPGWPDIFGTRINQLLSSLGIDPIKTLSLFSGGGGLDIAFSNAGFDIVECVEIDKRFVDTLNHNVKLGRYLQNSRIVCQDIRDYPNPEFDVDFIIGGPPCQTFSAAGARLAGVMGVDDNRGTLFEEYVRLVAHLKPKGFLFENVYRLVGAQSGRPWSLINQAFNSLGYSLFWRILDTADFGVPQHRERVIIVGVRDDVEFRFPKPSHGPDSSDKADYYTAGQAVSGCDVSSCKVGINGRHGHLLLEIPPGLNYSYYTEKMGHPKPIFAWRSKFSDYLYKADPEKPVRTIKAQGGQYTGPLHWDNRYFTVDEYKRLQTFPDNYEIKGNRQTCIHQIGNSVPPQLGRVLALSILNQLFDVRLPFVIDYLAPNEELGFRKRKSSLTKEYLEKAHRSIEKMLESQPIADRKSEKKGTKTSWLTADNRLVDEYREDFHRYDFKYELDSAQWYISVNNGDLSETVYRITISINSLPSSGAILPPILMESKTNDKKSILAVWKFLETLVRENAHKDDLVQLFGYYKNKVNSTISLELMNKKLMADPFWRILKSVSSGIGVGSILSKDEYLDLYEVNDDELLKSLIVLKELGFEVRNSSTNPQILPGYYIIPYSFPTLNERSLQRLTKL